MSLLQVNDLKRSNIARVCLGQVLAELPQRWALDLVDTLRKLGITPVRPS